MKRIFVQKIGLVYAGLVFCVLLAGCNQKDKTQREPVIIWENEQARALAIPLGYLEGVKEDSIRLLLTVSVSNQSVPILGEYRVAGETVIFRPVIAFTPGLKYDLKLRNKLISKISIHSKKGARPAIVLDVYPTTDTVPENLLKIHILFSQPMQEGHALENIAFIKDGKDTLKDAFLDLQPELWSNDRTSLTIWFDPGRIKRDLQPNKSLGPPLVEGSRYQIVVKKGWRNTEAMETTRDFHKAFYVGKADKHHPVQTDWKLQVPQGDSRDSLIISFNESLDYTLLNNAIRIVNSEGTVIPTRLIVGEKERSLIFIPQAEWFPGNYKIEVEARLEDLAGNNLNRNFDRDLMYDKAEPDKKVVSVEFKIK